MKRGVFWLIDDKLVAFPFDGKYPEGIAKSGNTYNHARLWDFLVRSKDSALDSDVRSHCYARSYDYYPRGRVDYNDHGKATVYMSPWIPREYIGQIMQAFELTNEPRLCYDYSAHYHCHLDPQRKNGFDNGAFSMTFSSNSEQTGEMKTMEINKEKTCCFTGHRPQKLLGSEMKTTAKLKEQINKAIEDGYDTFLVGMAPGVDIWAGEIIVRLKKTNPSLKLVAAVAHKGVERTWTEDWRKRFTKLLSQADEVTYQCDHHERWTFLARDRWMVENSSRIIGVFNGSPGGTMYTLKYAAEKGLEVVKIEDKV